MGMGEKKLRSCLLGRVLPCSRGSFLSRYPQPGGVAALHSRLGRGSVLHLPASWGPRIAILIEELPAGGKEE